MNGANAIGNILHIFSIDFDCSLNVYMLTHIGNATVNNPANILYIAFDGISLIINIFAIYM